MFKLPPALYALSHLHLCLQYLLDIRSCNKYAVIHTFLYDLRDLQI